MKIPAPTSVQIGGKTLAIKLVPNLILTEGNCGTCCMGAMTIEIDAGLLPDTKTETYLHECFEAINKVWMADSLSHDDIDRLGEALFQVLCELGIEINWD
jgi:hypothetical protein